MPNPRWWRLRSGVDWEPFLQYCSTLSQCLGLVNCNEDYFKIVGVDFNAQQLIPAEEHYEFFSFKFSLLIKSDESMQFGTPFLLHDRVNHKLGFLSS